MHAVIIGSSGGIGAALVEGLRRREVTVSPFSRSEIARSTGGPPTDAIDICDERSVARAAETMARLPEPELIIVATGVLSDGGMLSPEKSYSQQTQAAFERVFAVNTIGPALVAKHFFPLMPRTGRSVFAILSARVGSIGDNRMGGWHAYRASKAALNMLIKNYAIEQARKNPEAIVVGLHPGTVDTALSEPFQQSVPSAQLFSPEKSASALLGVIEMLSAADSGRVFDWAGKRVPN